jgi:hypothetical protein
MTQDEIAAHLEIQQILYRYCRGVDRGDRDLLASVYHPGAIDSHGAFKGPGSEFADFLTELMDGIPETGQHHITNMLIDLDGDSARVESYFLALHPGDGGRTLVGGRYLDRFEKRGGAWKIAERTVVIDAAGLPEGRWDGAGQFPEGGRRKKDPSFGWFATS